MVVRFYRYLPITSTSVRWCAPGRSSLGNATASSLRSAIHLCSALGRHLTAALPVFFSAFVLACMMAFSFLHDNSAVWKIWLPILSLKLTHRHRTSWHSRCTDMMVTVLVTSNLFYDRKILMLRTTTTATTTPRGQAAATATLGKASMAPPMRALDSLVSQLGGSRGSAKVSAI